MSVLVGGVSERDQCVSFNEEAHTYTVTFNGQSKVMPYSVTQVVHAMFPEFDGPNIARRMIKRKDFYTNHDYEKYWAPIKAIPKTNFSDIELAIIMWDRVCEQYPAIDCTKLHKAISEYIELCEPLPQVPEAHHFITLHENVMKQGGYQYEHWLQAAVDVVLQMWEDNRDQAAAEGTAMHQSIEDYLTIGKELPGTKESRLFMAFHQDMLNDGYIPYRSEQIVWDWDYSIAGSVDMMYIRGNKIYLVDWKRSKEIKMEGFAGKKGLHLMKHHDDCNYEHYSLQLNIYKHLLTKNYFKGTGLKIHKMAIVVLHPNQDAYIKLRVKNEVELATQVCEYMTIH